MNQLYRYWLRIAEEVAQSSKCLSRKIGAIIVTPDRTIVGTGYNGPPRKVPHCDSDVKLNWIVEEVGKERVGDIEAYLRDHHWGVKCPRQILGYKSGEGIHLCSAGHAERNAIVNSAREGVRTKGCYLVCACPLPCFECAKEIIGAGITKVICYSGPDYDSMSRWLLVHADVEIIQVSQEP